MKEVIEAFSKELVGKEFIYTSKYGGVTYGTIEEVLYILEGNIPESSENTYFRPDFRIKTKEGNTYRLNEIYVKEILKNHGK